MEFSLSQDLVRRLMNTDRTLEQTAKDNIINEYEKKLRRSGYTTEQIVEVIVSGLKCYQRKEKETEKENKKMHRPAKNTEKSRFMKKYCDKYNWFRKEN